MTKSSTRKTPAKMMRRPRHKSTPKVVAEKVQVQRKTGVTVAEVGDPRRRIARHQEFRDAGVPDTMRALAERSVVQTREIYERSKYTLQSVFENWQRSFGAAGQGAMALNRRLIDLAERNINAGFDLATSLCRAKNLAEVMELQAAYWQKQFGERPRRKQ